ncbi:hypothetical protein G7Z17_g11605 [Cylindrodendrum hubeiense]|uniref:Uncharacterized protein n=1 Tax=Cylindrodendrum hubeiense TaxID=595255 RepID=A0A9P5H2I7_9HYPO|nr:hypothetical protein G7Z17_g11605 [Cylindrodendrum hubeiense]
MNPNVGGCVGCGEYAENPCCGCCGEFSAYGCCVGCGECPVYPLYVVSGDTGGDMALEYCAGGLPETSLAGRQSAGFVKGSMAKRAAIGWRSGPVARAWDGNINGNINGNSWTASGWRRAAATGDGQVLTDNGAGSSSGAGHWAILGCTSKEATDLTAFQAHLRRLSPSSFAELLRLQPCAGLRQPSPTLANPAPTQLRWHQPAMGQVPGPPRLPWCPRLNPDAGPWPIANAWRCRGLQGGGSRRSDKCDTALQSASG